MSQYVRGSMIRAAKRHTARSWQRACTAAVCAMACLWGVSSAETIRLGGPRDVVVTVDDVEEGFSITVEMRPVSCFDHATNARINRSKAWLYGLAGLGKSLGIDASRLTDRRDISGGTVTDARTGGDRYRLQCFVPETAVGSGAIAEADDVGVRDRDASATTARKRSQLFTSVHDHEATITELNKTFVERVSEALDGVPGDASPQEVPSILSRARCAIDDVDATARQAFQAAERDCAGDIRLLTIEKESLVGTLAAAVADFDAAKAAACAKLDALSRRGPGRDTQEKSVPDAPQSSGAR